MTTTLRRPTATNSGCRTGNERPSAKRKGDKTYVTSCLCDRQGRLVGKYRQSHRLPYEDDIDLGDDLPVLATLLAAQLGGSPRNGGYQEQGTFALLTASELPLPLATRSKRVIRAAAIERDTDIDRLIAELDDCGKTKDQ